MVATWIPDSTQIGIQPIEETSTVQNHPLGTVIRAKSTYGSAEFIYLQGIGSTVAGSWVTYLPDNWITALIVPNAIGGVGVAMSANVASQFGWYMIHGKHPAAKSGDVADNGKVYIDTVAGQCDDALVNGDHVHNATWASADDTSTGKAEVELWNPWVDDVNET